MGRILVLLSLVASLLTAGSALAGNQAAPLSTAELKQVIGSGKKNTLVFFQNPQGGPCRAQKEILQKLQKDRKNNFNIANVSTMNPDDKQAFYDYGIRNLPMLVLVDQKGTISRVFPPGIQSYEDVAAALDGSR